MRRSTPGEVLTLAPDPAAARAASALARPGPWEAAGADDRAVWGRCRGTARAPYEVACDLADFAYRCTCPSSKQPCKHVLALLLLWARCSPVVASAPPPAAVAAWLAGRPRGEGAGPLAALVEGGDSGGAAGGTDAPGADPPVAADAPDRGDAASRGDGPRTADPGAAAARAARRARRIADGMAELDLWLGDLLRAGLASAASQPYGYWDAMAARLVDAQAPAAAHAVRDLAAHPHTGEGWPGRLLGAVCRLHLLAAGWARYDALPEETRADLRTAAGWPWPAEAVLAGDRETDRWYVLGRVWTDDPQLRVQRTWLWGTAGGRPALIVDFARPGAPFAWQLWPGAVLEAAVARYPGSAPLRVLVADQLAEPEEGGPPPGWATLAAMADARARARAADPWSPRWPVSVKDVVPERGGGGWALRDREGRRVRLDSSDRAAWSLAAVAGGRPVHVMGEWAAGGVVPLTAWADGRLVEL